MSDLVISHDSNVPLEPPRVVVRFRDTVKLADAPDPAGEVERSGIGPWDRLSREFHGLTLTPLLSAAGRSQAPELARRAMDRDPNYRPADFSSFFHVDAPPGTDLVALARELLSWQSVREAYVDQAGPDPAVNALDDPRAANQGYLGAAPGGIDARYAWTFSGGDGAGQRIVDLEQGWTLGHEDIDAHGATLLHGTLRDSSRSHGTAVLGEICAEDNTVGCVGIAPNVASVDVVSYHGSTRTAAILAALETMAFGDVLLLEAQVALNGTSLLGPIEAYDAEYEAIRLATALGVTVVEAGGNGTGNGSTPPLNMDTYATLSGKRIFDRDDANPDFRDSGAIIVTAASSAAPHTRLAYAPHGKRIDCYAWGHNIDTLASTDAGSTTAYTTGFGGTSGASPIVTGAALAVQGRAEAQLGFRFGPRQMRAILGDPATGTPRAPSETTRIGVMPNLRRIFDSVLNAAPDLYIRDHVGDTGVPHAGPVSASPDIILSPAPVANPQAAFGAGSGTENSATLGFRAEVGQDNHIYVRVLNQGGSPAADVEATVYWSPVATLVTPDLWTRVGSTTLPSVPAGEQLTVSGPIVWARADIPAAGHYCFVGLVGHAADPAPGPADFLNWDNFLRFIRENNNVTWRNFNVEDNLPDVVEPSLPEGFRALPFMAPGAPDRDRPMALEVIAQLPPGAKVLLEVPAAFYERLHGRFDAPRVSFDRQRGVARLPLNPTGDTHLGEILFPAGSRAELRLLVHVPPEHRALSHRLAVRQLWEGMEVGRVTWQLQPRQARPGRPGVLDGRCAVARWLTAVLLALLVVVAGSVSGPWLAGAGVPVLVALAGIAAVWVTQCRPGPGARLATVVAGAGGGGLALSALLLLGVGAPQLVPVLAVSLAVAAGAFLAGWLRRFW